jgi:hypothetical protein
VAASCAITAPAAYPSTEIDTDPLGSGGKRSATRAGKENALAGSGVRFDDGAGLSRLNAS